MLVFWFLGGLAVEEGRIYVKTFRLSSDGHALGEGWRRIEGEGGLCGGEVGFFDQQQLGA